MSLDPDSQLAQDLLLFQQLASRARTATIEDAPVERARAALTAPISGADTAQVDSELWGAGGDSRRDRVNRILAAGAPDPDYPQESATAGKVLRARLADLLDRDPVAYAALMPPAAVADLSDSSRSATGEALRRRFHPDEDRVGRQLDVYDVAGPAG